MDTEEPDAGGRAQHLVLPKVLNQRTAIELLTSVGWTKTRGGKHAVKMERDGSRPITLPHHKRGDYSRKLREAILKAAGLP